VVGQRHEVQTGPLTLAYLIGYWEISRQHLFGLLSRQTAVRGMIVMNVCVSGKPYPLGAPPPTLVRPPVSGAANARVAFSPAMATTTPPTAINWRRFNSIKNPPDSGPAHSCLAECGAAED